tara:strand:+ start:436 stop:1332 length:897 start_codon:yes stop_codon:yes gene_type:complete
MDIDFNINNYNLDDILNLFKLDYNFNASDLKNAKKYVLMLHPDRSGLDKEYFLFYTKAFRVINSIYEFSKRKHEKLDETNSDILYSENINVVSNDDANKKIIDKFIKEKGKNFNEWFNKEFEKNNFKSYNVNNGYGEWLTSNDDLESDNHKISFNQLHEKINEKKKNLSAIVKREGVFEISNSSANLIDTSAINNYQSDLFSKLPFEDLKIAHTETVIPVTKEDFDNTLKFNNVEVYKQYRNSQDTNPLTEKESLKYFDNKNKVEDKQALDLAYKLSVEFEESKIFNKNILSKMKLIK